MALERIDTDSDKRESFTLRTSFFGPDLLQKVLHFAWEIVQTFIAAQSASKEEEVLMLTRYEFGSNCCSFFEVLSAHRAQELTVR